MDTVNERQGHILSNKILWTSLLLRSRYSHCPGCNDAGGCNMKCITIHGQVIGKETTGRIHSNDSAKSRERLVCRRNETWYIASRHMVANPEHKTTVLMILGAMSASNASVIKTGKCSVLELCPRHPLLVPLAQSGPSGTRRANSKPQIRRSAGITSKWTPRSSGAP